MSSEVRVLKIKEGSRVCCLGDSLTEMGYWIYNINGYLSDIGSKTRFYNCGIGGNMSSDAPYYLEEEVLRYDPDYVIVMFGANDVGSYLYCRRYEDGSDAERDRQEEILRRRIRYGINMKIICQMLIQRNVNVILMTPMPFDDYERNTGCDVFYGAYDELKRCGETVKNISKEMGTEVIELCEQFKAVEDFFEKDGVRLYMDDRVHPNENGHKVMASIILKCLEYDIEIPKSEKELNSLPFFKSEKNDVRFETEKMLRKLSFIERSRYNYENKRQYFLSWEEVAEDLTRRCFIGDFEEWESVDGYKENARNLILNRPRKNELERQLIQQTETL